MVFFSIIIPVYNTQDWIKRCLDSCIQQTFSEIEIIVVDDCGNDDAISIATQYSKLDNRIKIVVNKENLGLFHARIAGEKQASGEYIIHLDSDDFIDTKLCETVFEKIVKTKNRRGGGIDIDIVNFGASIYPKPQILERQFFITPYLKDNPDDLTEFFACGWNIWGRAYSRNIVQQANLYIEKHLEPLSKINMAEDILKLFVISMFAKQYCYIPEYLYFYFMNPKSITKEISYQHVHKVLDDYNTVIKALEIINIDNTSSLTSLFNLKEQLIAHCKYMKGYYWILKVRQAHKQGFISHIFSFCQGLKYIKQIQGKRRIRYFLQICFVFFTYGKIKF